MTTPPHWHHIPCPRCGARCYVAIGRVWCSVIRKSRKERGCGYGIWPPVTVVEHERNVEVDDGS